MILPHKLRELEGGTRRRKLALCFGALERDIAGIAEIGSEYSYAALSRRDYVKKLLEILLTDPGLNPEQREKLSLYLAENPFDEHKSCNYARHILLGLLGTLPAEWDLIIAPHAAPRDKDGRLIERVFHKGLMVYAEDIRSPFNLGSIFRTAEAMGAEKVLISPNCTDPLHQRCVRSAMGCVETIPWERLSLDEFPDVPVFVLETGGTPLNEFVFPKAGIVIIGSEELGVSPDALKKGTYGRVSIPMTGIKASLNVGVAFGILLNEWVSQI